jgi:hypothetical protein
MASLIVQVHPGNISTREFPGRAPFHTLDIAVEGGGEVVVFVSTPKVLDALQAALDAIRAAMKASEMVEPAEVA